MPNPFRITNPDFGDPVPYPPYLHNRKPIFNGCGCLFWAIVIIVVLGLLLV